MLPGKLCIGILEEDNPLKAYFRFKPMLVEREGSYEPFDAGQLYPQDGCIRIVPDKNESSYFKNRMRRMGRWCILDLRAHASEGDKIRPNKNYHGDEGERNASIVYSDVLLEPREDMIFELAPADICEGDWPYDNPQTAKLISPDGKSFWSFDPPLSEHAPLRVRRDSFLPREDSLQSFELPGFGDELMRFWVCASAYFEGAAPQQLPEAQPARPESREQERSAPAAQSPEPKQEEGERESEVTICAETPPPPGSRRKPTPTQALAAQSGLNPRRGRSLQEVIDEKWKQSRLDRLGLPVQGVAQTAPLENPLESAANALREAWAVPQLRERLLDRLAQTEDLMGELDARCRDMQLQRLQSELAELEAERLQALDELERLKKSKQELRESFKREIRREEASALREAIDRTRAARAELESVQAQTERAREEARLAKDAFDALEDGRFEQRLLDAALASHAAKLLQGSAPIAQGKEIICEDCPTREEWLERMRRAAAAEGLVMDDKQAANLLLCAALGAPILLSGPASADKAGVARALARALGAWDSGRCCFVSRAHLPEKLEKPSELATLAIVQGASEEAMQACFALAGAPSLTLLQPVADAGRPVPAEVLEQGFLLRLEPMSAVEPWKRERRPNECFSPVRMQALRSAFIVCAALPPALERRLDRIRAALAEHKVYISAHTLSLMWDYCAAMIDMGRISPGEALDLAFAQKALPCILAEAPLSCLAELKTLLPGLPHCLHLLDQPLPIEI